MIKFLLIILMSISCGKSVNDQVLKKIKEPESRAKDKKSNSQLNREKLRLAIESSSRSLVLSALRKGTDINAFDRYGETALTHALKIRNRSLFRFILTLPEVDPNKANKAKLAPIHIVTLTKDELSLKSLMLNKKSDVNARDRIGQTALHIGIQVYDKPFIKTLLSYRPNSYLKTRYGFNCIDLAMRKGDRTLEDLLVDYRAVVEDKKYGEILNIIKKDKIESLDLISDILSKSEKIRLQNKFLVYLMDIKSKELLEFYFVMLNSFSQFDKDDLEQSLISSSIDGNTIFIKELVKIKDQFDINAINHKRRTALSYAVLSNNYEVVKILYRAGARKFVSYKVNQINYTFDNCTNLKSNTKSWREKRARRNIKKILGC